MNATIINKRNYTVSVKVDVSNFDKFAPDFSADGFPINLRFKDGLFLTIENVQELNNLKIIIDSLVDDKNK